MDSLADEILLMIFRNLKTVDLLSLSQVNKKLQALVSDSTLYREIDFDKSLNVSSTLLHRLSCQHHAQLISIKFLDCFWIPSNQMVAALQKCKQLKELIIIGSKISLAGLCKIFSNNKNIKRLGWSIPNATLSTEFIKKDRYTQLYFDIQNIFKNLDGIILRFDSLTSFENFLPIFDTYDIKVNEFGLEYLSDRSASYFASGNLYKMYIKCHDKFQICLKDAIDANRFLHFNILATDFVIQTVTKAAQKHNIEILLAPGNTNSLCWKYITSVIDILSYKKIDLTSATLSKEQMTWLSKLTKLTHLNLSNVVAFKTNLMRVIATNCTNLRCLNLSHSSDWIDKDLRGLEAVANHCLRLKELNLSSVHIHASEGSNKLCSIISKIHSLKSLSLPSCGLVNNIENNSIEKDVTKSQNFSRNSNFKPAVTSSLAFSFDSSSSSSDSTDFTNYLTRKVRISHEEDSLTSQMGSGLDIICKECVNIEELEVVNTGFNSAFNQTFNNDNRHFCPLSMYLKDKVFGKIGLLQNLRKLTFAGLTGVATFTSLKYVTEACKYLEELSIAYCGLSGNATTLGALQQALLNCYNLKRFRLDQPNFNIKEGFLESFSNCKRLQVICLINKNGKANKKTDAYVKLFHQCPNLAGFFIFNSFTMSESKNIQMKLIKSFKCRPSLCISILPYFNALTEEGLKNVPYVYLRDVVWFESKVAVCRYGDTL